jgi:hypothetical protein
MCLNKVTPIKHQCGLAYTNLLVMNQIITKFGKISNNLMFIWHPKLMRIHTFNEMKITKKNSWFSWTS